MRAVRMDYTRMRAAAIDHRKRQNQNHYKWAGATHTNMNRTAPHSTLFVFASTRLVLLLTTTPAIYEEDA